MADLSRWTPNMDFNRDGDYVEYDEAIDIINALENKISELESDIDDLEDQIDNLKSDINELELELTDRR